MPPQSHLPLYTSGAPKATGSGADFSILDIVSQIDEPLRLKKGNSNNTNENGKTPTRRDKSSSYIGLKPGSRHSPLKAKYSAQQAFDSHNGGTGDPEHFGSNNKKGHNKRNSNVYAEPTVMSLKTFE